MEFIEFMGFVEFMGFIEFIGFVEFVELKTWSGVGEKSQGAEVLRSEGAEEKSS